MDLPPSASLADIPQAPPSAAAATPDGPATPTATPTGSTATPASIDTRKLESITRTAQAALQVENPISHPPLGTPVSAKMNDPLPPPPPAAYDPTATVQTPMQVQSILNLPPPVLYNLARTADPADQAAIASRADASSLLSAMALPPPSPAALVSSFAATAAADPIKIGDIQQIRDHPALPVLLGQVFCPPTPGIAAPLSATAGGAPAFEPVFASVESWSRESARSKLNEARQTAALTAGPSGAPTEGRPSLPTSASFNEREISSLAGQMKAWALTEQEKQVMEQVILSKEEAVLLASQLAARKHFVGAVEQAKVAVTSAGPGAGQVPGVSSEMRSMVLSMSSGGPQAGMAMESAVQGLVGGFAETSRSQVDALASGYFAQLHQEARRTLDPTGSAPQLAGAAQAMNVQAAAAAAVAANVMAAKEISTQAGATLTRMGVNVTSLLPERPRSGIGLARLEVSPSTLAVGSAVARPAPVTPAVPPPLARAPPRPPTQQIQPPPAVAVQQAPPQSVVPQAAAAPALANPPAEVSTFLAAGDGQSCSAQKRDYLLSFAHSAYNANPKDPVLLPLLHQLVKLHSTHLPTLLLMSCVYYTRGEFEQSLHFNNLLLSLDRTYVEAMSNIGTTMRATGRWKEAEEWWWKAIQLRPTYWDATENLLGVLCNPAQSPSRPGLEPAPATPRFAEAFKLCEYVESQVFGRTAAGEALPPAAIPRPRILPVTIGPNHVHRVMNLFYAKGNLQIAMGNLAAGQDEYEKAVEVGLALPAWARHNEQACLPPTGISTRDLVLTAFVLTKVLSAFVQQGQAQVDQPLVPAVIHKLGVGDTQGRLHFETLAAVVRDGGDAFVAKLLAMGGGLLPTVLIEPTMLAQLTPMLFPESGGQLPALLDPQIGDQPEVEAARAGLVHSTNQTMSTMLLTIAKMLQDSSAVGSKTRLSLGGIPPSSSLLLPLYYVALALHPSPSTCNNLGILLSTLNSSFVVGPLAPGGQATVQNAQQLALKYYQTGLALDPNHPHLYTNIGSLLKDMGNLPQAIEMYRKAVQCNPNFDVALANLANAIKDSGQIQDSISFYQRAVELNPDFPEAVAGLVNALGGVCDWKGRGGVGEELIVDGQGVLKHGPVTQRSGYMGKIADLVAKQLDDGMAYGAGSFAQMATLEQWVALLSHATFGPGKSAPVEVEQTWSDQIGFILGAFDRKALGVCEGGFLIRLVERLMRRIQRRWYVATYGQRTTVSHPLPQIVPCHEDMTAYARPMLPPSLGPVQVPTVLPFHTFTLPVSARETRLISHRTGLRISHSTLQQPWMPKTVFPPPPPPVNGRIKLGYVSSDLGNHPLSHLMQSVFGMHDREKVEVFVYATSPSDGSPYRQKIENESEHFTDVSSWSVELTVRRIVEDGIHVLVNLSGYTKGARNEVFAARPAPVQMSFMGFAGTLAAGWCDYFVVDPIVCPPDLVAGNKWRDRWNPAKTDPDRAADRPTDFPGDIDPEEPGEEFVYTEKMLYLPSSYFVTDHKQNWREDPQVGLAPGEVSLVEDGTEENGWAIEEDKRWRLRKQVFPGINDDTFIFANFNQLYKIDPFVFYSWLAILAKHPNSILWLLRFPAPGEAHLKATAERWAGKAVADRIVFTDVANKSDHVHRGRVVDLFLDTTECNAHTTLADILWSGTPVLTFPRHYHKMASRVGASIAAATGLGDAMIVRTRQDYERRALELALGLKYDYIPPIAGTAPGQIGSKPQRRAKGELATLRRKLFSERETSALFDTQRWVRNLEKGVSKVWENWVSGYEFEDGEAWAATERGREDGNVWVEDDTLGENKEARKRFWERG